MLGGCNFTLGVRLSSWEAITHEMARHTIKRLRALPILVPIDSLSVPKAQWDH